MDHKKLRQIPWGQNGSIMTAALMMTAILTLIGVYCLAASTTEQQIAANMHIRKQAFYNADAGVQFALASLEKDLQSGKAVLPAKTGKTRAFIPAAPPPGRTAFTISRIRMLSAAKDGRIYAFRSTGSAENALGRIKARIRAEFRRPFTPVLHYAAFGDAAVAIQNTGVVASYNSKSNDPRRSSPDADNFESTHQADIASNKTLKGKNRAHIDGDCALGESGGSTATNKLPKNADIYGKRGMKAGRIAADPLGINSGGRYDPAAYKSKNDNGAVPASLTLKNGERQTLTGAPGGADYYFTDVVLQNGAELEIDTTAGPVNIFVDGGGFKAQNGSAIHSGGSAPDLAIYANHESTGAGPAIEFHNNSSLKGLVYAPGANVVIQNKADFRGAVWAGRVAVKNSGSFFYDAAAKTKHSVAADDLRLIAWQEQPR